MYGALPLYPKTLRVYLKGKPIGFPQLIINVQAFFIVTPALSRSLNAQAELLDSGSSPE